MKMMLALTATALAILSADGLGVQPASEMQFDEGVIS